MKKVGAHLPKQIKYSTRRNVTFPANEDYYGQITPELVTDIAIISPLDKKKLRIGEEVADNTPFSNLEIVRYIEAGSYEGFLLKDPSNRIIQVRKIFTSILPSFRIENGIITGSLMWAAVPRQGMFPVEVGKDLFRNLYEYTSVRNSPDIPAREFSVGEVLERASGEQFVYLGEAITASIGSDLFGANKKYKPVKRRVFAPIRNGDMDRWVSSLSDMTFYDFAKSIRFDITGIKLVTSHVQVPDAMINKIREAALAYLQAESNRIKSGSYYWLDEIASEFRKEQDILSCMKRMCEYANLQPADHGFKLSAPYSTAGFTQITE